jgi:hypothetical protein
MRSKWKVFIKSFLITNFLNTQNALCHSQIQKKRFENQNILEQALQSQHPHKHSNLNLQQEITKRIYVETS